MLMLYLTYFSEFKVCNQRFLLKKNVVKLMIFPFKKKHIKKSTTSALNVFSEHDILGKLAPGAAGLGGCHGVGCPVCPSHLDGSDGTGGDEMKRDGKVPKNLHSDIRWAKE